MEEEVMKSTEHCCDREVQCSILKVRSKKNYYREMWNRVL